MVSDLENGDGMEIITGVERRRWWSLEEKLRLVAECDAWGGSMTSAGPVLDVAAAVVARRVGRRDGSGPPGCDAPDLAVRSGIARWGR
ncbi:MAG: hypothetical protein ABF876_01230 [Acetobacter aceti]